MRRVLVVLLALSPLALPRGLGAEPAAAPPAEPAPWALGARVDEIEGSAPDGTPVRLSDLTITPERAREAVFAVAAAHASEGVRLEAGTELASLEGFFDGEELDTSLVAELAGAAGRRFGLVAGAERLEGLRTLGDVVAWIEGARDAPMAVVLWSSGCDTCVHFYNERLDEIVAETGCRMLVVACHPYETAQTVTDRLEAFPFYWRVALDPQQRIKARLVAGPTRTPHVFLLDRERVLRYRGGIDADPRLARDDEAQEPWLEEAIRALADGRPVARPETEPKGCPLPAPRQGD